MALEEISKSSTVEQLDFTIEKILKKALGNAKNEADRNNVQAKIDKYTTAKNKLIGICKNDIVRGAVDIKGNQRAAIKKLTSNNYALLSLKAWNDIIAKENAGKAKKDKANTHNDKELEDKKDLVQKIFDAGANGGPALVTFLKLDATIASGALLAKLGGKILSVPGVADTLLAFATANPLLAGCIAAAGVAAVALAVTKVFGPELKKLHAKVTANRNAEKAINDAAMESEADREIDDLLNEKSDAEKAAETAANERECESEATKLSVTFFKDDKEQEREIKKFKKKYQGKVSPEFIEKALVDAGLQPEALGTVEAYQNLMADTDFQSEKRYKSGANKGAVKVPGDAAHKGFTEFKAEYDKFIKNLDDAKLSSAERRATFVNLHNLVETIDFGTDADKKAKVQAICNGMVEIASAYLIAIKGKGGASLSADEKKTALEAAGLENIGNLDLEALANK